eukprot:4274-Heterococcus_DN1.PRE.5
MTLPLRRVPCPTVTFSPITVPLPTATLRGSVSPRALYTQPRVATYEWRVTGPPATVVVVVSLHSSKQ